MPDATKNDLLKLMSDRTKLIDLILEKMEKEVGRAQDYLMRKIAEDFVDGLDVDENGNIRNTLANKRMLSTWEKVYNQYNQSAGLQVVKTVVDGIADVMRFNGRYYSVFTTKAKLGSIFQETKNSISDWLGLNNRGGLVENGYLNRLLNDSTIRNSVKDTMFKSILSGRGFFETKRDLATYIQGNKEKSGAMQQYYRNFVYDTFNQVDRTQNKMFADKLGFDYAVYEGGLIKTSRPFCRKRNGKVFTREEIEKFDPPTAKPPNYNPFTDLGGYGCRHHLNWIPYAMAVLFRPDLPKAA